MPDSNNRYFMTSPRKARQEEINISKNPEMLNEKKLQKHEVNERITILYQRKTRPRLINTTPSTRPPK
ncbi:27265_t:CDS:2 [Gigaspora margarita]|uniref:27265_t:CDS:1 n=1 Tax=Gigaspora margarita TaxID=4874 RepID=A0ABN7VG35_GIGMA|nr:27265_t:CDS:2 [Gigaspora margarita]